MIYDIYEIQNGTVPALSRFEKSIYEYAYSAAQTAALAAASAVVSGSVLTSQFA